ncbi:hypothetical protein ACLB1G_15855 [Oxalobacteraceae bacterium A2-2]
MNDVLAKTFGGLSKQYYFRQLFFAGLITLVWYLATQSMPLERRLPQALWIGLNTLLYPYSRFVYESVIRFIVGQNFFIVNGVLFLATKLVSMLMCYFLAMFIAPVGLAYLYYHHSKART